MTKGAPPIRLRGLYRHTPTASTQPGQIPPIPPDPAISPPSAEDLAAEGAFPDLPYDDPGWFSGPGFGEDDAWEIGPAIPPDALVIPPELTPSGFDRPTRAERRAGADRQRLLRRRVLRFLASPELGFRRVTRTEISAYALTSVTAREAEGVVAARVAAGRGGRRGRGPDATYQVRKAGLELARAEGVAG